jgi:Mn2+/Fe2+ NRAMP family transporter
MISWLVRGILVFAGAVTGIFVSKDQPSFGLMETMVAFLMVVLVLFVVAFWPARWSHFLNRRDRDDQQQ